MRPGVAHGDGTTAGNRAGGDPPGSTWRDRISPPRPTAIPPCGPWDPARRPPAVQPGEKRGLHRETGGCRPWYRRTRRHAVRGPLPSSRYKHSISVARGARLPTTTGERRKFAATEPLIHSQAVRPEYPPPATASGTRRPSRRMRKITGYRSWFRVRGCRWRLIRRAAARPSRQRTVASHSGSGFPTFAAATSGRRRTRTASPRGPPSPGDAQPRADVTGGMGPSAASGRPRHAGSHRSPGPSGGSGRRAPPEAYGDGGRRSQPVATTSSRCEGWRR